MNLCTPINILCVYRSPSTDVRSFIETLNKVIKEYEYEYKSGYTVLIGDMNINIVGDNLQVFLNCNIYHIHVSLEK